jgi:membrane-bound metal-dependent hydrolase YbcI (DUF457 family)
VQHRTHQCVGAGIAALVAALMGFPAAGIALSALLGGFIAPLPDVVDFRVLRFLPHRNWVTHSVVSPALLAILCFTHFILLPAGVLVRFTALAVLLLTWVSHLALDALNPSGIHLWIGKKLCGSNRYDAWAPNLGLQAAGVLLLVVSIVAGGR